MEKIKYIKFAFLISIVFIFIACAENQRVSTPSSNNSNSKSANQSFMKKENVSTFKKTEDVNTKDMKITNKNGILFVNDGKKEYVLSSKGLDYNVHLSSDKIFLVLDILKTNNLQTIELFSKKDTSRFKRIKKRFKRDIWTNYLRDKTYEFKDVNNPQLIFHEWVDNDTFELKLSYEFEDKYFEKNIRYDIY